MAGSGQPPLYQVGTTKPLYGCDGIGQFLHLISVSRVAD